MNNVKQHLLEEIAIEISAKEREIQHSDDEVDVLNAKIRVENKILQMKDLKEHLREDYKYSAQALADMLAQEQQRNAELKKDLEILEYRKAVVESKFSDQELDN